MLRFIDRFLTLPFYLIFGLFLFIYSVFKKKTLSSGEKKISLFLASGSPYRYPKDKINDLTTKLIWNKGFRSQLLHPGYALTCALYLGQKNEVYKLCPGIIVVSIKKIQTTRFRRVGAALDSIRLFLVILEMHKKKKFYSLETFLPGDRLLLSSFISKFLRLPLVVQCQGDYDLSSFDENLEKETNMKMVLRLMNKAVFSFVLRQATLVLGYSDHCASFLICNGAAPHKVRRCRVYSFIEDFDAMEVIQKESLPFFPKRGPVLFLWGRLAPEKKFYFALEALKKILAEHQDIQLLIAGDGPLLNDFLAQTQNFKNRITLLGHVPRNHIKSYIMHATANIVPLGGHAVIEAGMCKKPVVGFNWEWHGEVITHGKSGILVDYPNLDDLKTSIIYLLENLTKAVEMGQNFHARVVDLFNYDAVHSRHVKIWDEFHLSQARS